MTTDFIKTPNGTDGPSWWARRKEKLQPHTVTRDAYLAWITDWRRQYAELTTDIRRAKLQRKTNGPDYLPGAADRARRLRLDAQDMLLDRHAAREAVRERLKAEAKAA